MAEIEVDVPGVGKIPGTSPIVILGPNGSGKTQLAQSISKRNRVSAISAQRRTWVDTGLPVQEERYLIKNVRTQQEQWHERSWQPTEDLQFILTQVDLRPSCGSRKLKSARTAA